MSAPLSGTEARWLDIIQQTKALEPEPDIRTWIEEQRIPIKATHNRAAAAAGATWEFSKFRVFSDWIFDFIKNDSTRVTFRDGTVRTVRNRIGTVIKNAQSGVTSIAIHCLAWWITWRGGNVIMVTASRDMARDSGKDKFDLLDQYAHLKASKLEASTALATRYPRSIVWLGGGQSASAFISNPCSLALSDECAKHTLIDGMAPSDLLKGRLTADSAGKLLEFSTPDDAADAAEPNAAGKANEPPPIRAETAIVASHDQGTCEVVEVPCPHCGFYQELDRYRLQFNHCKTSLPDENGVLGPPIWDRERVVSETWYQCANPDCTDRHADGSVRGRIEDRHKPAMIEARRYVATNLSHEAGHRSLKAGGLLNVAFDTLTFGAIADAFLTATKKGSLKAFITDVIGEPYERYKVKDTGIEAVKKLTKGYRRLHFDGGRPLLKIPLNTEDIRFIGLTADVQRGTGNDIGEIGSVPWFIFAADMNGECFGLDWGIAPSLASLTELVETKVFCSRDEPDDHHLTIDIVCIDINYAGDKVRAFIASQGGSSGTPRWCALSGRAKENERRLRGRARITEELPGRDSLNNPIKVRTVLIRSGHWESELHFERIHKQAEGKRTASGLWLPADVTPEFLDQLSNMEQVYGKPDKGNIKPLIWRKRNSSRANDFSDLARNALVVIDAVHEEIATGKPQL